MQLSPRARPSPGTQPRLLVAAVEHQIKTLMNRRTVMARNMVNVADMRKIAKRRLPRMVFDYLDGAALDEVTLRENAADLEHLRLRQRVLQDVSQSHLETDVLGQRVALPIMISPMGALTLVHPDADLALARAAVRAGTIFIHSAWSGTPLEEVAKVAPHSTWAQIAFWKDKGITRGHVDRAAAAGVNVLVVAGDVGVSSKRERDLHHRFDYRARPLLRDMLDAATKPAWLTRFALGRKVTYGNYQIDGRPMRLNEMGPFMHENDNPGSTWADVEELRSRWSGKIVVKGVMTADDTRQAVRSGVDAVIVSNHGVYTTSHRLTGVVGSHDSFNHNLSRPPASQFLDVCPRRSGVVIFMHEWPHLIQPHWTTVNLIVSVSNLAAQCKASQPSWLCRRI